MELHQANKLLKTPITFGQLDKLGFLYTMLGLSNEDFCKMVDAVGVETLTGNEKRYEKLFMEAKKERKRACVVATQRQDGMDIDTLIV